jgi:hypothetical protein
MGELLAQNRALRCEIESLQVELRCNARQGQCDNQRSAALEQVRAVVHGLSQPMTVVLGYAQLLPRHLGLAEMARYDCQVLVEQVQRMAFSLGQLRVLLAGGQSLASPGDAGEGLLPTPGPDLLPQLAAERHRH